MGNDQLLVAGLQGWSLLVAAVCVMGAVHLPAAHGCDKGYFGFQCKERCSGNCLSEGCHDMTGDCPDGCKDGWFGPMCEYECEEGTYGTNCSYACSDNCLGSVCQAASGNCIKGCADGYMGLQCDKACGQGTWGENCKMQCSTNCATPHCHFETGHCLKGCKTDFWGADCSLFGSIRDMPDQMRARFYSQLSAESRSVLLYVLMGEYGRTLEKAQREIDDGIKQRNELRHLLAGRDDARGGRVG